MNVELELISNVVASGDFSCVRKRNLTPSAFETDEAKVVYEWLWSQYHDPKHPGEVPDKDRLLRRFPDFPFRPTRNSVEALVHEMVTGQVRGSMMHLTEEMSGYLDNGEDPLLVLAAYLPKLRELNVRATDDDAMAISAAGAALQQEYLTKQASGGITGIPYPWKPLNVALGGMQPEQFIVFYARPKNAKTWLLCAMAEHAYLSNRRVLVYSKEMAKIDLMRRTASILCGIDYDLLLKAQLSAENEGHFFDLLTDLEELERETQQNGRRRSLTFISDHGLREPATVEKLAARAEQFDPDIVLVDGFYLMSAGEGNKRQNWERVMRISNGLKAMAQALRIPVVGTTQANRAANDKQGDDLDELAFADAIGMDADVAIRCFLGKSPAGSGSAVLLTFPGVREAKLSPLLINFRPGEDFSVLQTSVDVREFLRQKKAGDREVDSGQSAGRKKPGQAKRSPFRI